MRRVAGLLLFVMVVSPPSIDWNSVAQEPLAQEPLAQEPLAEEQLGTSLPSAEPTSVEKLEEQLEGDFDAEAIVATSAWVQSTGVVDWLGPLAPIALSPFFGVTCLSGMALWGPEWVTDNALLGSAGPLKSQTLFFVLLVFTILTSVPRLTKVSKPFAQAVDRLETYAVIVILLLIKIASSMDAPEAAPVAMVQLGVVSFTLDALLAIAMVINVLVINSVKFFFEFMVWLTPVPFLDAVFEVCNKSLCAVLMAIYAFSPTVATVLNLLILLFAAIVLRWISRRVRFYRTMVLDPIVARLWTGYGKPKRPELIVFPKADFGPFAAKSRLRLCRAAEDANGWKLTEANWWMPAKEHTLAGDSQPRIRRGWIMHAIEIDGDDGVPTILSFSRRFDGELLAGLIEQLGMRMSDDGVEENEQELAYEFG